MPFPFVLPTTSAFSFSSSFTCDSHPSLPLNASTYRGVVRDTLKKHKRLHPSAQAANLSLVVSALNTYLPYLLALDAGLQPNNPFSIRVTSIAPVAIEWRPTLSDSALIPGKEPPRVKVTSLEHELAFALSTLAAAHTLQARAALQPLHVISVAPLGPEQRQAAITSAFKLLLDAASIYKYLSGRSGPASGSTPGPAAAPSCPSADISPQTTTAQGALALAEATILSVLKDDPYPAAAAQSRNANDREWMYKAPDLPKVRALLFGRLCLAASEHCAQAAALCQVARGSGGSMKLGDAYVRYVEDLRRTSRARACRFFGIHDEMEGQTGKAIGWLKAALQELGVEDKEAAKKGFGLGRLKKEWAEKKEDRKVEKGVSWGSDAGRAEEGRVVEMLLVKWNKENDTMNTQVVPAPAALLTQMPSGRDIHVVKPFEPPVLDSSVLETMRIPPDRSDDFGNASDSDDETIVSPSTAPGAYPDDNGGRRSYY